MFHEGQQIGSYILISRLGRGGFGEVWLAEKRSQFVTKKLAVKLPLDEQVNFETIKHEATLWEQASGHPNVLPIIDADVYDGQVVIVSEYADGGSLADKLKREGRFSVGQAAELIIGILNGLEFLHNRRIIHRDIKPQNILLQGDTPRLADFGISRAMQTTAISSAIIGTDAYMAPEAFDGRRSVQSDIWAVGVVLYQLLKGSLPFPQDHPSERMFAIFQKEFEPLPGDVPQSLRTIIGKSLAKLPENRYASAAEMRSDLQKVLRGEPVSGFPPVDSRPPFSTGELQTAPNRYPMSGQVLPDESETVVRTPPGITRKTGRRSATVIIVLLAFMFFSAVGGVYFLAKKLNRSDSNKNAAAQVTPRSPAGNIVINVQNTGTPANANTPSNVNSGPPPLVAPHIKPEYRTVLENWFEEKSDWRPATVNDALTGLDKDGREFAKGEMQHNGKFRHPYYVADDFNQDGKQDFAVLLIGKKNRKKYAVAIFNAPFGDSPTYYTETVENGDWLFWMKDDEYGGRFIVGPPASDSGYVIVPRGNKYVVEVNNEDP